MSGTGRKHRAKHLTSTCDGFHEPEPGEQIVQIIEARGARYALTQSTAEGVRSGTGNVVREPFIEAALHRECTAHAALCQPPPPPPLCVSTLRSQRGVATDGHPIGLHCL